nr:hypothetical protein [Escherichia coli]
MNNGGGVVFFSLTTTSFCRQCFSSANFYRAVQKRNHHYLLIHLRLWFPRQETPQIRCQLFFSGTGIERLITTLNGNRYFPVCFFFRHELNKIVLCDRRVNIALVGAECVNIRHTGGRDYSSMRSHLFHC